MRYLAALIIITASAAMPFRATAIEVPNNLSWPAFAPLNQTYKATAVREGDGISLKYQVGSRTFVKQVAVPANLWSQMKNDFRPRQADVVVAQNGELSSVEVKEKSRELWITFERSSAQCLEMVYPSGRGLANVSGDLSIACGS